MTNKITNTDIIKDLQEFISTLPESQKFEDFYSGGAGQTILELLSGVASMTSHQKMMLQREASIQNAQLLSSVVEHSINKGFFIPTAKSRIVRYTIKFFQNDTLSAGDIIGKFADADYDAIFLQGKESSASDYEKSIHIDAEKTYIIDVIIGYMETTQIKLTNSIDFVTHLIKTKNRYLDNQFENLQINKVKARIVDSNMSVLDKDLPKSVLRLPYENNIKLIFGNDITGIKVTHKDDIQYTTLMFNNNINNINTETFESTLKLQIESSKTIRVGVPYLDKEQIRFSAIRNSVDGRIIDTKDYERFIMKELYGYINDVFIDETFPYKYIYILPKETLTPEYFEQFKSTLKLRRLIEDRVFWRMIEPVSIKILFNINYSGDASKLTIDSTIKDYKDSLTYKIFKEDSVITSTDVCINLTEMIGNGKFTPNEEASFSFKKLEYIDRLSIRYTMGE